MFLDKYSSLLSFMNNNYFLYDIFSKTLLERINNRYKIEDYSYSIFDYFTLATKIKGIVPKSCKHFVKG